MARSNDPFWNHVVRDMNDAGTLVGMKCKFCGHPFARDTSISRIKWHLSGEKGHGVSICEQVPKQVQEAAFLAMQGGNKRQRTIASSSNVNDNPISTCPQEENYEVHNLARNVGRIQLAVQGTEQEGGEERTSSRPEAGNVMDNVDIEGMDWQVIASLAQSMDEEDVGGALPSCSTKPVGEAFEENKTKLVGETFEKNKNLILSWLRNDEVSRIGIYGMGGVGKTALVKCIYNQLKRPCTSCEVYWVTVSQDFSINRLQNSIARHIGLDLSDEEEDLYRAEKLSEELMKRQKWVLILDDLWNSFDLNKVGIPVPVNGCKLILTTRSLEVCRRMDCKQGIKVEVLSEEQAWTLFMEKLAHDVILSPEVEQIAKSVMRECAGLPLGIITVAGSMKGVDDLHEWRNTLEKLKQSKGRDMEDEVFGILKYSYDRLNDFALQQCLLYCALFPEDYEIPRKDLIGYLIDEGIIEGMNRRQAEFDEGYTMLNKLENVCLLESGTVRPSYERAVKMHDLIRDMAHQILRKEFPVMVGEELLDVDKWKEDLLRVSFMRGWLEEIPSSHSPRCLSLSALLLSYNENLRFIADSFFKELHGLKILDLSHTDIEILPDSVSDLTSLSALLLRRCCKLRHVPSLEKVRTLKRLDLSGTSLENVPQGMECLSKLRYLRMNGCGLKEFPSGILPKLSRLQVLIIEEEKMGDEYGYGLHAPITVKGEEVACLRKLETLKCHFEHVSDFAEYFKTRDATQSLSTYQIIVGQLDEDDYSRMKFCRNKCVGLGNFCINSDGDFQVMFPNDIEELMICKFDDAIRSLCDVSSLIKSATELEVIDIWNCNSMKSLVSISRFCSASPPSPSNGIFSGLKRLYCHSCKGMKLLPVVLLPNLVNLEVDEERVMREELISLPKSRILRLEYLPELKSFYSANLICSSLQEIERCECRKPIYRPFRVYKRPTPSYDAESQEEIEPIPMRAQMLCLINDDKVGRKAMDALSSCAGVKSIRMNMNKRKMTIVGYLNIFDLVSKLRKIYNTEILTAGPMKEEEDL